MNGNAQADNVGVLESKHIEHEEPIIGLQSCKLIQQGAEAVSARKLSQYRYLGTSP